VAFKSGRTIYLWRVDSKQRRGSPNPRRGDINPRERKREREREGMGRAGKWTIDFPCHKRAPARPLSLPLSLSPSLPPSLSERAGSGDDTSDLLQVPDDGYEIDLCGQRWDHLFQSRAIPRVAYNVLACAGNETWKVPPPPSMRSRMPHLAAEDRRVRAVVRTSIGTLLDPPPAPSRGKVRWG